MSKSRTLRLLLWVNLWLALSAAVSAAQVALSSYAFSPLTPPIISTDEPMPQTYKLRAKFIGVPGYVDGYHAATSWQNNGYQLDMLPGAGTWTVALYWLKYNDSGSTLLEVGPTQNVTVVVGVGAVGLSASYFAPSQRPTISTGDPMPARYRLFAHFDDGSPAGFEAATAWNNNAMLLDGLPPEGTYPVTLYWRKYDATGTSVTEAGPQLQDQVTISSQPTSLLNTAGYIWSEETFDEETGDPTGTNYSSSDYSVTVSMAGQLTVYTTGETDTYGAVWGPGASAGADTGGDHPNFSVTITVVPGDYSINVGGNSGGEYQVHAIFTPPQLTGNPPVVTSAGSASGMPGLAFSYNVTATNSPTAFTASGLPPGLSINGSTGAITGMPVQGSGTYYVTLHAANATAGLGPAYVVAFNLTKGSQNITFGSLANKTYGNAPFALTATASSGLPVTYSVLDGPATVAGSTVTLVGEGAVTIRAAQAGNSNYNAAVSVDRSFVVGALTPVRVALQYWQAGDYPGIQTYAEQCQWVEATSGGWGYNITGSGSQEDWANWDGSMQELTDPDGNSQGSLPSPYSVEWVWSDGVAAHWDPGWLTHTDGLLGSSWTTNAGTFDINSPTSNYAASTTYRGNFAYSYAVNDRISFRVRGLAPGGNCNTYQAVLYSPSGATLATYNAASADGTFYPTTTGVYRVELAYSGATGVIPASGLVTYYIPVGVSPTTIAAQPGPAAQAVTRGATVTYAVSATGTNLTYQWRKHGLPIAGATAATLARTNVQTVDAGIYSVTVAGANGTVTSSGATLTVNPPAPSITSALTATVAPGATFAYVITGNESPTTFGATGLPPGLTVNIATGAIGGTCSQLGTYSVTLSAANVTGAGTATLTLVVSTLADSVAPTVATGLNYAEKTATTITLVWRAGTDNIGIVRYEVYRGTTSIGSTSDLVFADGGLTANGTYVYKVVAFDAANNSSPDSALLTVTTTQDSSLDTNQDGIPNAVETALGIGTGSGAGPETPTTKTNQVIHRPKT